jgi:radical SAM superfamily enzyme with C-terminal helix-hairpin-helix motif
MNHRIARFGVLAIWGFAAQPVLAQVGRLPGLLEANLAPAGALSAVPGLSPDLVKVITSKRPFLSAAEFDAALAPSLTVEQRTAVYRGVFVHADANQAPEAELRLIPGIDGPTVADIVANRPYTSLAQLRRQLGKRADEREVTRLSGYLFVPIELNSASDDDILSIPGVGRRMLHEFKEYRPYRGLEQFRREIGKYVDRKELARLQRYVRLDR